MAYNTLTGTVNFSNAVRGAIESMVDDYSTQTVGGTKSFTSTLSASAFRSEAGDVVPPALTAIGGDSAGRLIVSDGDGTATCDATLTFSSTSLTASYFSGSARGLTALPIGGANVDGQLSSSNIYYGVGLTSDTNQLVVSGGEGISTAAGVTVDMATNGGLGMSSSKLRVDPYDGTAKASLSNNDQFLISDSDSSNVLKSSTMTVLRTYMQDGLEFSAPGGSDDSVQTKSGTSFAGSSNLTFDGTTLTLAGGLTASVNISASAFYGDGSNLSNLPAAGISWDGSTANGVATYKDSDEATVESNLTFDGSVLAVVGNVGIGTTNPAKTLEVKAGSSGDGINLIAHDNSFAYVQLEVGSAGGYIQIHDNSNIQKVRLDAAGDSWIGADGGNVGIGTIAPTEALDIDSDAIRIRTAQTPATSGATGTAGTICWDSSYIYVCIATNTWMRAAITTW